MGISNVLTTRQLEHRKYVTLQQKRHKTGDTLSNNDHIKINKYDKTNLS
jgi:hypothetical protein